LFKINKFILLTDFKIRR